MKGVKMSIYIIALLLFVSNYAICDYFFYNEEIKDIDKWWDLKSNIYGVIMACLFGASLINLKGFIRVFLILGVFLSIGNVIDKLYFNVLEFTLFDILLITLAICYAVYDQLKLNNE